MSLQKDKEKLSYISFSAYTTYSWVYSSTNITCLESNSPFLASQQFMLQNKAFFSSLFPIKSNDVSVLQTAT